jgi:Sigma-54 interaction domain
MNGAAAPHIPRLDSYQTELGILRAPPANVLIEGPSAATDDVLLAMQQHLREPLVSDLLHAPLHLPDGATTPVILKNVAALTANDQARLLAWLQREGFGAQVVSTTERPLFGLVTQGLFDAALYYRLNVLLLHVGAADPRRVARRRVPRPLDPEDVLAPVTSDETAIAEDAG